MNVLNLKSNQERFKRLEIVFNVGVHELVQWSQPHKAIANTE